MGVLAAGHAAAAEDALGGVTDDGGGKLIIGRCIDNGPMGSFWGMLKSEMYYLRRFTDKDNLIQAIENYIYFYNNSRYQKRLRCMTPMEFHYAYAA